MKYKQMWADPEFIKRLEQIKFRRMLNGDKGESVTNLTRKLVRSKKFDEIEEELLNINNSNMGFRYD